MLCLSPASCSLPGLSFDFKDEHDMFLRNVGDFYWTTHHYVLEDSTLKTYVKAHKQNKIKIKER
jgi:hypothetical protein